MNVYPLDRPKLSNEHIMTFLFGVLLLFQIPAWIEEPMRILLFFIVLAIGLVFDLVISMRREGSLKCAVSAAITVGIIYAIFPAISFWGGLVGTLFALAIGKQLWGGMGKNSFNPAMLGVLLLSFFFPTSEIVFVNESIIVFAMLLSLIFIIIRPFASISFILGMLIALSFSGNLSAATIVSTGMLFWAGIIMTDPVTITYRPMIGAVGGLVAGVSAILFYEYFSAGLMALIILCMNGVTAVLTRVNPIAYSHERKKTRIKKAYQIKVPEIDHTSIQARIASETEACVTLGKDEVLDRIKKNKVVGLGGAAFPTHLKIESVIEADVKDKYFIVNAVECDPGLVHDAWILREFKEEIEKGIHLLCDCIPFSKVLLATKNSAELNFQGGVELVQVQDLYPIGAEKKLIRTLLEKDFTLENIPAKNGVLVLNVQTVYSIYQAVYENRKAESKFITFANLQKKEAQILKVSLDERVSDLINYVCEEDESVFVGGGLMQAKRIEENELIDQTTNFIAVGQIPRYKEGSCSKCGACVVRCPSGLEVYKIASLVEDSRLEETREYHPEACISCGICSYYCLAGKNLSKKVQLAKGAIKSDELQGLSIG